MTYLEKFMKDHPDISDKKWFKTIGDVIENSCPSSWGYKDCPKDRCNPHSYCKECWNREIPNSNSWVRGEDGVVRCGNCERWAITTYIATTEDGKTASHQVRTPYCPYCGAPMDNGTVEKDSDV